MIDHVSASWGLDENMSMYRHMYNDSTGKIEDKLGNGEYYHSKFNFL
jgi:hypothetical protein